MSRSTEPFPFAARLARVRAHLSEAGADVFVITELNNIRYLTGFAGSAGILLVTAADSRLLIDGRYEEVVRDAQQSGSIAAMEIVRVKKYDPTLIETVAGGGWRHLAFEGDHTTVAQYGRWVHGLTGVTCTPVYDWVESARIKKDEQELAILRRAGRLLSGVAESLGHWVAVGKTEREVAGDIDTAIRRAGFEKPAFDTIVATGPNSAYPHARPTDRAIQKGDLVLLDFGGVLEGYCVDLTRMAGAGRIGADSQSLYMAVRLAQDAAIAAVGPGSLTTQVDRAARQVLEQHQLGSAFVHGTGHGLGLDVHEAPRVGPGDPSEAVRLESGMVVTIEPGAYVVGLGGVRLEDDVLVTAEGREVLTTAPLDLLIV
jgi:Xaa-Pro aminopeptidase